MAACEEFTMIVSVFIGTSVDGFIARLNGTYGFLPEGGGEPHGYDEFMASVDTLVIGRKTFEAVLALPAWPYCGKNVVVLSSKPVDFSRVRGNTIQHMVGPPWKSLPPSLRKAPNISTSMEELRFKDSCAMGSFNVSSSRGYLFLSARESLSLAHYREICTYVT
jgi:hypothetical protein